MHNETYSAQWSHPKSTTNLKLQVICFAQLWFISFVILSLRQSQPSFWSELPNDLVQLMYHENAYSFTELFACPLKRTIVVPLPCIALPCPSNFLQSPQDYFTQPYYSHVSRTQKLAEQYFPSSEKFWLENLCLSYSCKPGMVPLIT